MYKLTNLALFLQVRLVADQKCSHHLFLIPGAVNRDVRLGQNVTGLVQWSVYFMSSDNPVLQIHVYDLWIQKLRLIA